MNDKDIFLEAINNLPDDLIQAKFEGHPPSKKAPNKRKIKQQNSYDKEVDLHGMTKREALSTLQSVMSRAKGKHLKVLVITGKGLNSEGGHAVIRDAVMNYLSNTVNIDIQCFNFAPLRKGGDGAIEIITK